MNYYQMIINSEQASLITRALDFWCRIHGGQLEQLRCVNIDADADDTSEAETAMAMAIS